MEYDSLAKRIRVHALRMTHKAKSSHIGSNLSIADILAELYGGILKDGDKFILSKGHACAAVYAVLAERGFFPIEWLDTFCQNDSLLAGHITHYVPGVEASTGSLGHGLSIGCGMALATKQKVYVLLGDGDCNEGSTWEAAMFASHHKLDNLVVVVDYNKLQALGFTKDILELDKLSEKWRSFGFFTMEVDGHDLFKLNSAFQLIPFIVGKPNCIISHTIKGKGVSFMENKVEWHYKYPDEEELKLALEKLK